MRLGVGEHPLFRTLVVYGASLVSLGCGGKSSPDDEARAGAAGSGGEGGNTAGSAGVGGVSGHAGATASVVCPKSCTSYSDYVCDDYTSGDGCRCDPAAPNSFRDCEVRWDYQCASAVAPSACGTILSIGPSYGCTCVRGLRPEDCEQTWHFQCDIYYPTGSRCRCDPNAPSKPEDCPPPASLRCEQIDPPAACSCVESIPIR